MCKWRLRPLYANHYFVVYFSLAISHRYGSHINNRLPYNLYFSRGINFRSFHGHPSCAKIKSMKVESVLIHMAYRMAGSRSAKIKPMNISAMQVRGLPRKLSPMKNTAIRYMVFGLPLPPSLFRQVAPCVHPGPSPSASYLPLNHQCRGEDPTHLQWWLNWQRSC